METAIMMGLSALAGGFCGFAAARLFTPAQAAGVAQKEHDALKERLSAAQARLETQEKFAADARAEHERTQEMLRQSREKAAGLEAEKRAMDERLSRHEAEMKAMQEQNRLQFENLAAKLLDQTSAKFNEQSGKSIGELLNPLKERLNEFQKKVDDSFGTQAKEQFALKEEIRRIVEANEKITLQADNLTRALKGDVKAQGAWGEIILERILEESGLKRDLHYVLQGAALGLKHVEENSHLKPDVIIHLPDGKHVVVDSKVSLTAYERYCSESDEVARAAHSQQFLTALRRQVKELEERRYQETEKLGTPDFVLMFMPIEGAYAFALQQDPDLHPFAWNRKVILVCPSTLFATLRTIESVWKIEMQNRNVQKIAEAGGRLYDKIAGFVEDMKKLGMQMDTAAKTYGQAWNKLSDGKGNMLRQAEQMRELGAKTSKLLPRELLEAAEGAAEALEDEAAA